MAPTEILNRHHTMRGVDMISPPLLALHPVALHTRPASEELLDAGSRGNRRYLLRVYFMSDRTPHLVRITPHDTRPYLTAQSGP